MENNKKVFNEQEVVYSYGLDQAEEDGILFNISSINNEWQKGVISHITNNLLSKHNYFDQFGNVHIPCLLDLLNQVNSKLKKAVKDNFYSFKIENLNGEKMKVFVQLNESEKFTVMLP